MRSLIIQLQEMGTKILITEQDNLLHTYSSLGFSSFGGCWPLELLAVESLLEDKLEDEPFFGDWKRK